MRDQGVGELGDPVLAIGGLALVAVDLLLRLAAGLVEHLVGLALDGFQDRADSLRQVRGERREVPAGGCVGIRGDRIRTGIAVAWHPHP